MYGYVLIFLGFFLLGLAMLLRRWAVRAAQRETEEHTRFLIETYGRECYRRAASDSPQEQPALAGKEVAS